MMKMIIDSKIPLDITLKKLFSTTKAFKTVVQPTTVAFYVLHMDFWDSLYVFILQTTAEKKWNYFYNLIALK